METKVNILGLGWVGTALKDYLESLHYQVTVNNPDENALATVITWPAIAQDKIKELPRLKHLVLSLSSTRLHDEQQSYEKKLSEHFPHLVILRLGGLIGYDRHPGRFFAGKKDLPKALHPTNLIHRDDVVRIIELMIRQQPKEKIYNLVGDHHPTKKDFYTEAARLGGFEIPSFHEDFSTEEVVTNSLFKHEYNYQFTYPSPFDYLRTNSIKKSAT